MDVYVYCLTFIIELSVRYFVWTNLLTDCPVFVFNLDWTWIRVHKLRWPVTQDLPVVRVYFRWQFNRQSTMVKCHKNLLVQMTGSNPVFFFCMLFFDGHLLIRDSDRMTVSWRKNYVSLLKCWSFSIICYWKLMRLKMDN